MEWRDMGGCFVCGKNNPQGLKLSFQYSEGRMETNLVIPQWLQGWDGVLHGGILATLLDEVMVKLAQHQGLKAVTARLNIRYKNPARIGEKILLSAEITKVAKKLVFTHAFAQGEDQRLLAEAWGELVQI